MGSGVCFLLCFAFFRKEDLNWSNANSILSFLFFILGFVILNTVLNFTGYSRIIYGFEPISNAFCLALGPLLYLYIGKLAAKDGVNWILSGHMLPFYGYLALTLLVLFFPTWSISKYSYELIKGDVLVVFWNMQFATYLSLAFIRLRNVSSKTHPNARLIYWGIASIWAINTLMFIYNAMFPDLPYLISLNITLLFTFLSLRIAMRELLEESASKGRQKMRRLKQSIRVTADDLEIIQEINTHKYYQDADLNIRKLSDHLQIPYHQLSVIINSKYNKNFNEFINGFRVRAVVDALLNQEHDSYTILGLAQEAGFKSGSAFYSAFKKEKGTTPRLFLRDHRSAS